MTRTKSLYLIDGHNLLYRTFFALPRLSAPDGTPTNVILGMARILLKILREESPAAVAAVFDSPAPTPRHALYPEYKAGRHRAPEDLAAQVPLVREVIDALGVARIEVPGVEADDVIGTLARLAEEQGMDVVIVSSDKDLYQLVSEKVKVRDGVKERTVGEAEVREAFGIGPAQVVDLLALAGDPSDNVPGVPGIGEKTAAELIREFGSLEGLLARTDRLKGSRKEKIEKNADMARLCRDLIRIDRHVPLPLSLSDLSPRGVAAEQVAAMFRKLGFRRLLDELGLEAAPSGKAAPAAPPAFTRFVRTDDLLPALGHRRFARAAVALPESGEPSLCGVSADGFGTAVFPAEDAARVVRFLSEREVTLYGYDGKSFLRALGGDIDRDAIPLFDTQVAGYLLSPDEGTPTLSKLRERHAPASGPEEPGGPPAGRPAGRADMLLSLGRILEESLASAGLSPIFRDVDMPLLPVLLRMEEAGIRIDPEVFRSLSERLTEDTRATERKVSALAGMEFNINSPKQLAFLLFEKLGLPTVKRTKTGYSTDMEVLEQLKGLHEIPGLVLEYRTLEKIRSTYVDVLPGLVDPRDGRIHTTFHQTQTATGRLSSSGPNLQNIPIRTDLGRRIRSGFVAEKGHLFVGADYSQVELRLLAHLSGCRMLIRTFLAGEDVHTATACSIFGITPLEVTPEHRRKAKIINFGILYGMSPFGLSRELGIGGRQAKQYIDQYFARYPGVRDFFDRVKELARKDGYVYTILGRRRIIRDINSRNRPVREAAERMAVNTPIQGSAADVIKLAMIRVDREFRRRGMDARLVLQVHDELVVEVSEREAEEAERMLREAMEGVARLAVPLVVSIAVGRTWGEIH
jgi:DNA polymerase I